LEKFKQQHGINIISLAGIMIDHKIVKNSTPIKYTCNEYRQEMILAGLKKRLTQTDLSEWEVSEIEKEIYRIEKVMDF
jgi:hypothetical protein